MLQLSKLNRTEVNFSKKKLQKWILEVLGPIKNTPVLPAHDTLLNVVDLGQIVSKQMRTLSKNFSTRYKGQKLWPFLGQPELQPPFPTEFSNNVGMEN